MSWHLLQSYQTVKYDKFDIVVTFFDDQLYVTASGSLKSRKNRNSIIKTTLVLEHKIKFCREAVNL